MGIGDWDFNHPGLEATVIDKNGRERKVWATKELYADSVKESLPASLQLYSKVEKCQASKESSNITASRAVKLCTPVGMHLGDKFNYDPQTYGQIAGILRKVDVCSAVTFYRTEPSTTHPNSTNPAGLGKPYWRKNYPTLMLGQLSYVQDEVVTFLNLYNNMRDIVFNLCGEESLPAKYAMLFKHDLEYSVGVTGPDEGRSEDLGWTCERCVTSLFQLLKERVGELANFNIDVNKNRVSHPRQTTDREINCWMDNDEFVTSCFELVPKSNTTLFELALGHPDVMQLPDSTASIGDIKQQILQAREKAEKDIGDISNFLTDEQKADRRADCVLEAENAVDYPSKLRYLTSERLKIAANGYFRAAQLKGKAYSKAVAAAEKLTAQLWCGAVEDLRHQCRQGLAVAVARACPVVGLGDADCLVVVRVDVNQDWDAWDSHIHCYTKSESDKYRTQFIRVLTDKTLRFDLNVTPLSEIFAFFGLLAARKLNPKFEALITGDSNREEDNNDGDWLNTYIEPRFATLQRIAVFEEYRKLKLDLFNLGHHLRNLPGYFVSVRTNLKFETKPAVVRQGSSFRSTVLKTEMTIDGERTAVYVKMLPITNCQEFNNELRAYKRIDDCGKTGEFTPELYTAGVLLDMESIGEFDDLKSGVADYEAAGLIQHPRGLDMMKQDLAQWFKAKSDETYAQDTSMDCSPDCPFKEANNGGLAHPPAGNTKLAQTMQVPASELGHVLDHIGRPGVRLARDTLARYLLRYSSSVGHNTEEDLAKPSKQKPAKVFKRMRPKLLLVTKDVGCAPKWANRWSAREELKEKLSECGIIYNGLVDSNMGQKGEKWYAWDFGGVTFKY